MKEKTRGKEKLWSGENFSKRTEKKGTSREEMREELKKEKKNRI